VHTPELLCCRELLLGLKLLELLELLENELLLSLRLELL
jgi:hypothetical protein